MNESFALLRGLLRESPSEEVWDALLFALNEWSDEASLPSALDYVEEHLSSWPDGLRVCVDQVEPEHPCWPLVRVLRLRGHGWATEEVWEKLRRSPKLRQLEFVACLELRSVGKLREFEQLRGLALHHCTGLMDGPRLGEFSHLSSLSWVGNLMAKRLDVSRMLLLRFLSLQHQAQLQDLVGLSELRELDELRLDYCGLLTLERLWPTPLPSLRMLSLRSLPYLRDLGFLRQLPGLQSLCLALSRNVEDWKSLGGLAHLRVLDLQGCRMLEDLDALKPLRALEYVNLGQCVGLQSLDGVDSWPEIRVLSLRKCSSLVSVDALFGLKHLEELDLSDCPALSKSVISEVRAFAKERGIRFVSR